MWSALLAVYTCRKVWLVRPKHQIKERARKTLFGRAGLRVWVKARFLDRLNPEQRQAFCWWLESHALALLDRMLFEHVGKVKLFGYGKNGMSWFFRDYPISDYGMERSDWRATFGQCWNRPRKIPFAEPEMVEFFSKGAFDGSESVIDEWMEAQEIPPKTRGRIVALTFWEYEERAIFYVGFTDDSPFVPGVVVAGYSRWGSSAHSPETIENWDSKEVQEKLLQEERAAQQSILTRRYEKTETLYFNRDK
jgi:hypothetical protein